METLQNKPSASRQVSQFIWEWVSSRNFLYLVQGFLAIAGAVIVGYLIIEKIRTPIATLEDRYLAIGTKAFENEDYEKAALCFRRVISYDQNSHRAKYHLAIIADEANDKARAAQIMVGLANQTNEMTPAAAFWLVEKRLEKSESLTSEDRLSIIKLLERVVKTNPKHLQARLMFVKIHSELKQWDKAISHLKVVTEDHPDYFLNLSRLYLASGNPENAKDAAKSAENEFKKRLSEAPSHIPFRLSVVESLLIQQKYKDAKTILREGFDLAPSPELQKALSNVYLLESRGAGLSVTEKLALLKQAITWNLRNRSAYDDLGKIVADSEKGNEAQKILEKALATGSVDPGLIHTILGTAMLTIEKPEVAKKHLEIANRLNPNTPLILNNLALAISKSENANFDKALKLLDIALETSPENIQIHESRGQILVLLKNWDEALKEFEYVLPYYRKTPQFQKELPRIHKSLASIYKQIGNPSLAKQHKQLAEETAVKTAK